MITSRRGQPVIFSHLYCTLVVYGALLILTITTPTKVSSAKLSKGTFIRSKPGGNGCTFEEASSQGEQTIGSNMIKENRLDLIKPANHNAIQSQVFRKNNYPLRISRPIGYITLSEYCTLSLHDGKTTPVKMNAFLDYLLEENWKTSADCWKEEFQKTKIDSRELASLQLNWLKENVKENPHAKELNAGKTVDDLLGKTSRTSIQRYGKYMKDIVEVDQSTMNEFIDSYVKKKWKEIFQDTKIFKLSDIIHIHIEWAKLNDEKSLYVLMSKNPGQELEAVSKIMERNLKNLELYHLIKSVLENNKKLDCSTEEIGFFILNQGGNAAEDPTSAPWNFEKVKRMFEEWKDYKAKKKIESSQRMILRKQFNILLPRVFGINTDLVQTLNREIGDHGQIWFQKHPRGPNFYFLPNLISTHLDWLQNNDQTPPSISENVKLGVSLQHIAEELEPHFHKMNLDEFVLLDQ
ncbi:hypothetical protein PGTUg99_018539 [Puccinia graminis f. sp. tritici]|uniref:Uncharacterized protein n=1 Tax=Puccinia graminis f. sp. tritici TaxID=56615 RepID=A0A5B0RT58_PUCGR|nr:hypothetical protein PGTUg99_018539 [Puccinia graminis f. sp. tritici]